MKRPFVIHGHFYQPPRENPWTEEVDREPSASPFHDWNERIHQECYAANAFARIHDSERRISAIRNNYDDLSFNFGPTLLSWIERHHPQTYSRILEADRGSTRRHAGHGNAIAQAYNHAILPLCNDRDRRTQIEWGLSDFRFRFGRDPESLWLPETAVSVATLGDLIDAGLSYVILAPGQAKRIRKEGTDWLEVVGENGIDPGRAYRFVHPDGSGREIAIFFYDAPLARAIAFEGGLSSSEALVEELHRASDRTGGLVHVATDGESYGHHAHFGDLGLAFALDEEAAKHGLEAVNYGAYLEAHPPNVEVEIADGDDGLGSSWSCSHGVGRWHRDCGCRTGGEEGWNQAWRGPLREALDHLRDVAAEFFAADAGLHFEDPWAVRDEQIVCVLDRSVTAQQFLQRCARATLSDRELLRMRVHLELQRQSMLSYTSCGWFFNDLAGLETIQVMKYAARSLDLIAELGLRSPRDRFLDILSGAWSNDPSRGHGADIFVREVEPLRVTPVRIRATADPLQARFESVLDAYLRSGEPSDLELVEALAAKAESESQSIDSVGLGTRIDEQIDRWIESSDPIDEGSGSPEGSRPSQVATWLLSLAARLVPDLCLDRAQERFYLALVAAPERGIEARELGIALGFAPRILEGRAFAAPSDSSSLSA